MPENTPREAGPHLTMREAINLALAEALAADDRVLILGEDVADPAGGVLGATKGLSTRFGDERVRDTPISETAIIGAAIGAAVAGLRPVAEVMIMDFIGICLDQIANHAAKLRYMSGGRTTVPLTVRTAVFGGTGGGATHSQSLEAWLAHVPGLKVVMPSTPADAKGLLTACIFDDDPCVFIEPVRLYGRKGAVPADLAPIALGTAKVAREGSDVSAIAYGAAVVDALGAAEALAGAGVSVEVVDLRCLVPLDTETVLASVCKTRRAVVAHTATMSYGPGAELAARISHDLFGSLAAPVVRVGAPFVPIPASAPLERAVVPGRAQILTSIGDVLR
ncbi:MAG: alpha-ketoacid dehydrogenase subunit beta [Acidimicrobiales bacterium]